MVTKKVYPCINKETNSELEKFHKITDLNSKNDTMQDFFLRKNSEGWWNMTTKHNTWTFIRMWITEKEKPSYLGSNWENLNMDSTLDDTESMLNFLDVTAVLKLYRSMSWFSGDLC